MKGMIMGMNMTGETLMTSTRSGVMEAPTRGIATEDDAERRDIESAKRTWVLEVVTNCLVAAAAMDGKGPERRPSSIVVHRVIVVIVLVTIVRRSTGAKTGGQRRNGVEKMG